LHLLKIINQLQGDSKPVKEKPSKNHPEKTGTILLCLPYYLM